MKSSVNQFLVTSSSKDLIILSNLLNIEDFLESNTLLYHDLTSTNKVGMIFISEYGELVHNISFNSSILVKSISSLSSIPNNLNSSS
ncbi:hypothetical protein HOG21_04795 [bacterium]|nr:hypothetical protein [bacterium]